MKERLKMLRKELGLTQEKFADRLSIKRNTIAKYETGRNEPIDAVISLICREYNVSEKWLRNGEGDMFIELPEEDEYMKAATELSKNNDRDAMNAVVKYWKLDPSSKRVIWKFINSLSEK